MMDIEKSLKIIKALADSSRLAILNALSDGPRYVEELARRTHLAESTVSFHLKKLESAELVSKVKDQYYSMYSANTALLGLTLGELASSGGADRQVQEERDLLYRTKVLQTFFEAGRLTRLPVQKKKRLIVLDRFAALFHPGTTYREKEVDNIIAGSYEDYCTIRRELVDAGYLYRKDGLYRAVEKERMNIEKVVDTGVTSKKSRKEHPMDQKTALKRQYKENPPPAGVFMITNKANGKVFIGKGMNVQGKLNGQRAQLRWKGHKNQDLQEDWDRFGPESFTFEVVDFLDPSTEPARDAGKDLDELLRLWLDKLKPYEEKGYNDPPKD